MNRTALSVGLTFLLALLPAVETPAAEKPYKETWESLQKHADPEWFRDAKFGLFIHWGISSLLMDGEWVMQDRGIRVDDYERIAPYFNPERFDADAWATLART